MIQLIEDGFLIVPETEDWKWGSEADLLLSKRSFQITHISHK